MLRDWDFQFPNLRDTKMNGFTTVYLLSLDIVN